MKIAVAVDGSARDSAVLAWTAHFARPGDDVHVIHAYQELALEGSAWLPAVRANDHRRHQARRVVATAQSSLHASLIHARQIAVGGSVVTGWPHQVLADVSTIADLLVVGSRPGPGPACVLAAACPVVIVPASWRPGPATGHDVGVLCGRTLPLAAIDGAVDVARREHMSVVVLQLAEPADGDGAAPRFAEAAQLERLDMQLAAWDGTDYPPMVAEVRREDFSESLRALSHVVALVATMDAAEFDPATRTALDELHVPVLRVPDSDVPARHPLPV